MYSFDSIDVRQRSNPVPGFPINDNCCRCGAELLIRSNHFDNWLMPHLFNHKIRKFGNDGNVFTSIDTLLSSISVCRMWKFDKNVKSLSPQKKENENKSRVQNIFLLWFISLNWTNENIYRILFTLNYCHSNPMYVFVQQIDRQYILEYRAIVHEPMKFDHFHFDTKSHWKIKFKIGNKKIKYFKRINSFI